MDDRRAARPSWRRRLGKAFLAIAALALSALGGIVLLFAIQARVRLSDLQAWHRVRLEEEFRDGARGATPRRDPRYNPVRFGDPGDIDAMA